MILRMILNLAGSSPITGLTFCATGLYFLPSPFFFFGCGPKCDVLSCIVEAAEGESEASEGEYPVGRIGDDSAEVDDEGEVDTAKEVVSRCEA
jgi:hypothetical protein